MKKAVIVASHFFPVTLAATPFDADDERRGRGDLEQLAPARSHSPPTQYGNSFSLFPPDIHYTILTVATRCW